MSEQSTEGKGIKVPTAEDGWSKVGGASFDKERGKIDWTWKGEGTLVLAPGSSMNFWRNEDAYEGQPEFNANVIIASGGSAHGRFRADHPTAGTWGRVGGGFLKREKRMISWSWTGERNLELPPGSRLSIWKNKKEGAPEFQVSCLIPGGGAKPTGHSGPKDNAVDEWMTGGGGRGEPTQTYRAPGAGEEDAGETGPTQGTRNEEPEATAQPSADVDPKALAGNPAQDPGGAEAATQEQASAPPQTETYDDFDDDIPF